MTCVGNAAVAAECFSRGIRIREIILNNEHVFAFYHETGLSFLLHSTSFIIYTITLQFIDMGIALVFVDYYLMDIILHLSIIAVVVFVT